MIRIPVRRPPSAMKIGSLRFLLLENLLDYFEAIFLRRCIPRLDWKRNLYQKPHALSSRRIN